MKKQAPFYLLGRAILPADRFQRVQPPGKAAAAMIGRPTKNTGFVHRPSSKLGRGLLDHACVQVWAAARDGGGERRSGFGWGPVLGAALFVQVADADEGGDDFTFPIV